MYARLCAKENQLLSDWFKKTRTKPVMTLSYTLSDVFPRSTSATSIYSSFDWCIRLFLSFAIGQSDDVGFRFTTLD